MISVSIEGRAGQALGPKWKLHVATVGEVLRALRANAGSVFEKALGLSKGYVLVIDGVPTESSGCFLKKIKKSLCFIPVLAGGFIATYYAIAGSLMAAGVTTSIALAGFIAVTVIVAVVALIAYGIYSLVSLLTQDGGPDADGKGTNSFAFHGPENVSEQGQVIPVGYGRLMSGSRVISVSSTNVDKSVWEDNNMSVFGGIKTVYKQAPYAGGFGGGGLRGAAMWSVGETMVDRIQD
jgi:predicted phage tail protein